MESFLDNQLMTSDSAYFNWMIHPKIKSDVESMIYAKQLVFILSVGVVFFLVNAIKWFILDHYALALSLVVIEIITIGMLVLIKMTGLYKPFGHGMLIVLTWHFSFLLYLSGGIQSTAITWMIAIPVFSSTLCDSRSAIVWTSILLIVLGIFLFLHINHYVFPSLNLSDAALFRAHLANTIGPIIAVFLCSWFANSQIRKGLQIQKYAIVFQEETNQRLEELFDRIGNSSKTLQETSDFLNQTSDTLKNNRMISVIKTVRHRKQLKKQLKTCRIWTRIPVISVLRLTHYQNQPTPFPHT
ncbi:MAG: Methyl-accepting chemotaxis protein signaling domain protein [Candidatus Magnetoglobus multicellularis str. Araruama]|uniref:Methyl-accepting chemotaxis protein signaling domain protein n=1 Tax=Candidatus Magnetoglobus multicellularis str. Araruama TaxID=890399 RepID=A0A1V1PGR2_9BACT|nr:MAG: Methyl-accepting chemotaxis protein signaling domain protein [Candidatus Magnetoglobus multicellularis str. Araruama]